MKGRLNRNPWHKHGYTVIIYMSSAALMASVSIFSKNFFVLGNFKNLLCSSFPLLTVALGQTLATLIGGIDLSLGGIVALCNVVCVTSMNPDSTWGFVSVLGTAAAVGLACEAVNGVLVTKGRLASIIITMATTAVFDGTVLLLMPNSGGSVHKASTKSLTREYSGAVPFLLFTLILCLVRSLANSASYGKVLRAIGGSENTVYSTGMRVGKVKFYAYYLAGLLCAVAGIFLSVQMNSADVTMGKNYAMNAITATVVGGTAMVGAAGDPLSTIAGMFITSIINNILNLLGASPFYQFICQGLVLTVTLSLNALHKRHQGLRGPIIKDRKVR